jgi:hypothetical protein
MSPSDHIATLQQWAAWQAGLPQLAPDWEAASLLIAAAEPWFTEESANLRRLLERSAAALGHHLDDPLLSELGVNRWLDRELSYSDWLAWVLQKLNRAESVLRVLCVTDADLVGTCAGQAIFVLREEVLEEGWEGQPGQIDILVRFGNPTVACVGLEVKAWDEQYAKNRGYLDSLERNGIPAHGVLICNRDDLTVREAGGFHPCTWRKIAQNLRREIKEFQGRSGTVCAAMMLGFIAAVEQNLLGLGVASARLAWRGLPTLPSGDLSGYLQEVLSL